MLPTTVKLRLNKTVTLDSNTNTRTQRHKVLYFRKGKLGFREVKVVYKPTCAADTNKGKPLGACKGYIGKTCHVF